MAHEENRRTFLRWAIHGLGAIFGVMLGFPAICYLIDPRNRPAPPSDFRLVPGVKASLVVMGQPVQGVIRAVRRDAWTLHPNDVIGRVWITRVGPGNNVADFQVFTTICPHLGCFVNLNLDPSTGFTCPCHNAQFQPNGDLVERPDYENAAPRPMDSLAFQLAPDPDNPEDKLFEVEFQSFEASKKEKIVRS